jgi:hypothetical protein
VAHVAVSEDRDPDKMERKRKVSENKVTMAGESNIFT